MTLARFLRDYVFTSLSRLRIGGSRYAMAGSLVALLADHGAVRSLARRGWTFVIWGTLQGVAIVVARLWGRVPADASGDRRLGRDVSFFVSASCSSAPARWRQHGTSLKASRSCRQIASRDATR